MRTWSDYAFDQLDKWFPALLSEIGQRISLHIHPSGGRVAFGQASATPSAAEMHFVSPAAAYKQSSYYDANWHIGNIGHELAHCWEYAIRKDAGGYSVHDTPRWFHEGFGEYFRRLILGNSHVNQSLGARYNTERSGLIQNGFAGINDVYGAGDLALQFMSQNFGHDAIIGILRSSNASFWGAVTEHTNLSMREFELQFIDWLKK